jgi:hypothetical protein
MCRRCWSTRRARCPGAALLWNSCCTNTCRVRMQHILVYEDSALHRCAAECCLRVCCLHIHIEKSAAAWLPYPCANLLLMLFAGSRRHGC